MIAEQAQARRLLILAGILGALAVTLGAFGAHGLKTQLEPRLLAVYHTAVDYHFIHSLVLVFVALALSSGRLVHGRYALWAAKCLIFGLVLFCGSLYALAISGVSKLGMITPLGGVAFILAWLNLALAAWKGPESKHMTS